jgi:hypothetical protein
VAVDGVNVGSEQIIFAECFERKSTMHVLKSVGVMSVAKIMGLLYGCMGLIFAPIFLLVGVLGSIAGQDKTPFAGIVGIVLAVLMPVLYGAMGFVSGAIGALLYNLLAKWVGGFELELDLRPAGPVAPYPIIPPASSGV